MPLFRPAPPRSARANLLHTALQSAVVWTLALVVGPALVVALERRLGIRPVVVAGQRPLAVALLAACSLLNLATGAVLAVRGAGTPLPRAAPRRLVVRGPYRVVRNPMALAGLGQGVAVALWLGSWSVLAYVVAGALLWHGVVRPVEERDLARRFGAGYARYRDAVPLWWPRPRRPLSPHPWHGDATPSMTAPITDAPPAPLDPPAGRSAATPLPDEPERGAALLRTPLLGKLVVADLSINALAFLAVRDAPPAYANEILFASLFVTLVLNAALVWWALLPLRILETTTRRVSAGDLAARVRMPSMTDRNLLRIGETLNQLLDHLSADRERMRQLAAEVISAGDAERAHIARELHDSTAQALTALEMLATATLRGTEPTAGPTDEATLHERLRVMRDIATDTLREVRTLSHNVHPRVLDDLGLAAALEFLARRTREQSGIAVRVQSSARDTLPGPVASVLYRVAQEAVRNAVKHAAPATLTLALTADARTATLEIADDGAGFDVAAVEASRRGMGLFVMRERLALVDGQLEILSTPGAGTVVRARAPLTHLVPA